jgi:hypothetical protein
MSFQDERMTQIMLNENNEDCLKPVNEKDADWLKTKKQLYDAKEQAFAKIWKTKPVYMGRWDKDNNEAFGALLDAIRYFKVAEAAFNKFL